MFTPGNEQAILRAAERLALFLSNFGPMTDDSDWQTRSEIWSSSETSDEKVSDLSEEDDEMWPELQQQKKKPRGSYVCHNCYQANDHYIQDCPRQLPDSFRKTPYLGTKRCVGEFFCANCKRSWLSHRSTGNKDERCKKCKAWCFPRKQFSPELAEKSGIYDKQKYRKYNYGRSYLPWSTSESGEDSTWTSSSDGCSPSPTESRDFFKDF